MLFFRFIVSFFINFYHVYLCIHILLQNTICSVHEMLLKCVFRADYLILNKKLMCFLLGKTVFPTLSIH